MLKCIFLVATLVAVPIGMAVFESGPKKLSRTEANEVFGGQCGNYSRDLGGGCNPTGGWGPKFWEGCPSVGTLTDCMTYNEAAAVYTCTTTCGYHCGTYKSGYTHCSSFGS